MMHLHNEPCTIWQWLCPLIFISYHDPLCVAEVATFYDEIHIGSLIYDPIDLTGASEFECSSLHTTHTQENDSSRSFIHDHIWKLSGTKRPDLDDWTHTFISLINSELHLELEEFFRITLRHDSIPDYFDTDLKKAFTNPGRMISYRKISDQLLFSLRSPNFIWIGYTTFGFLQFIHKKYRLDSNAVIPAKVVFSYLNI